MKNKASIVQISVIAFAISGLLLFSGCKKEVSNSSNGKNSTATNSQYYLTGLLGGQAITISGTPTYTASETVIDSTTGGNSGGGALPTIEYSTGCNWVVNGGSGAGSIITTGSVLLDKLQVRVYVAPTSGYNPYYDMLQTSAYTFKSPTSPHSGCSVSMRDNSGVLWTSYGDQTGSSFKIVSYGSGQSSFTTFSGVINCKMYDVNGNVKQLTSAAFNALAGLQ